MRWPWRKGKQARAHDWEHVSDPLWLQLVVAAELSGEVPPPRDPDSDRMRCRACGQEYMNFAVKTWYRLGGENLLLKEDCPGPSPEAIPASRPTTEVIPA